MLNRKVGLRSDLVIELADGSLATQLGIADKELVPIVLEVAIWDHKWIHRNFLVRCNNEAVVHVIHQPVVTQGVCISLVHGLTLMSLWNM